MSIYLFLTATQKAHNDKLSYRYLLRALGGHVWNGQRRDSLSICARVMLSRLATVLTLMELAVSTRQVACKAVTKSMHSHLQGCFRGYANEQDWNVTF